MRLLEVKEKTYHFSLNYSKEEFFRQLSKNCCIYQYKNEIRCKGGADYEICLYPENGFNLYRNSFSPVILIEMVSSEDHIEAIATCKPQTGIRGFVLAASCFLVLMFVFILVAVFFNETSDRINPFVMIVPVILLGVLLLSFPLSVKRTIRNIIPSEDGQ